MLLASLKDNSSASNRTCRKLFPSGGKPFNLLLFILVSGVIFAHEHGLSSGVGVLGDDKGHVVLVSVLTGLYNLYMTEKPLAKLFRAPSCLTLEKTIWYYKKIQASASC